MKRFIWLLLIAIILTGTSTAFAAKARGIETDADSKWHEEHIKRHIGENGCHGTGNYLKVRKQPNGNKLNGHLEQADRFTLVDVRDGMANVVVTYSDVTSPDSYVGLSGWVNVDYIDCNCGETTYYQNSNTVAFASYADILDVLYFGFDEEWSVDQFARYSITCDTNGSKERLFTTGYLFIDLNGDGIDELLIGGVGANDIPWEEGGRIWMIFTMKDGVPVCVEESGPRYRLYLREDGSIFTYGSDGAGDHTYELLRIHDGKTVCVEGVWEWLDFQGTPEYNGYYHFGITEETGRYCMDYPLTEQEARERISRYCHISAIDYLPLIEWHQ